MVDVLSSPTFLFTAGRGLHNGRQPGAGVLAKRNPVTGRGVFRRGPDARRERGAGAHPSVVHQTDGHDLRQRGGGQATAGDVQSGEHQGPREHFKHRTNFGKTCPTADQVEMQHVRRIKDLRIGKTGLFYN